MTITIVLTDLTIASINCSEGVTWKLSCLSVSSLNLFLLLLFGLFLLLSFLVQFDFKNIKYGVENSRAVVTDEHGSAAMIALGQDLRAASTSALAIEQTYLVITEIHATLFFAKFCLLLLFCFFLIILFGFLFLRDPPCCITPGAVVAEFG